MITELWSAAHYRDAHIQVSDWTDYAPSFWLLNGRGYPDTLAPSGDPRSAGGGAPAVPADLLADHVQRRRDGAAAAVNLGYQNHAMTVDNIDLTVVAKDASLLARPRRHAQLPGDQQRRRRPRREPGRALHRARARASTCSTTGTTPTGQRGAAGLRRHDDRSASARPGPSAPDPAEHLTGRTREDHETTTTRCPRAGCRVGPLARRWSASAAAGRRPGAPRRAPPPRGCSARPTPKHLSLTARDGYVSTPDGNSIYMWGYGMSTGHFQLPGPTLCVTSGQKSPSSCTTPCPRPPRSSSRARPACRRTASRPSRSSTASGALTSMVQPAAAAGGSVTYQFTAGAPARTSTRAAPT